MYQDGQARSRHEEVLAFKQLERNRYDHKPYNRVRSRLIGTRGLMAIQCDGDYRVAQYIRCDAYPSGIGEQIIRFAKTHLSTPEGIADFREKVRACKFDKRAGLNDVKWDASLLEDIARGKPCLSQNHIDLAYDSAVCEWAYVIDLDAATLECYRGMNFKPLEAGDRFFREGDKGYKTISGSTYYPIKLIDLIHLEDIGQDTIEDIVRRWENTRR